MFTHWQSENGKWAIRQHGSGRLMIENTRTGQTDYPVRYQYGLVAGRFGYDMEVPAYVDRAMQRVWFATR